MYKRSIKTKVWLDVFLIPNTLCQLATKSPLGNALGFSCWYGGKGLPDTNLQSISPKLISTLFPSLEARKLFFKDEEMWYY